jgi:CubicO group peptidase (beta-lactamase class C family)
MWKIDQEALARIRAAFDESFARGEELGAEVSIWQDGHEVLRLHRGWRDSGETIPWDDETLVLVWSSTKGPAAACVLHALQEKKIGLETPVAAIWPEFAASGKARINLTQLLAHRAGLALLDHEALSVFDLEGVADALAAEPPHWVPDTAHGYAPRTSGLLEKNIPRSVGFGVLDRSSRRGAWTHGADACGEIARLEASGDVRTRAG